MKKRSLNQLLRAAQRNRDRQIRALKRPWVNIYRLATPPCDLPGVACSHPEHARGASSDKTRESVSMGLSPRVEVFVYSASIILFCGVVIYKNEDVVEQLVIPPVIIFALIVLITQVVHNAKWSSHADELEQERVRLEAMTPGMLLAVELKGQIEAARKCLLEGDAGLTVWHGRVTDQLESLPATETATVSLPGGDRPYHHAARVTVIQAAADQADLYEIAGAYRRLNSRIVETTAAHNSLAEILGQSIDRRDVLGRAKGAPNFDPCQDMATITREVNEKLDALFTELKILQTEVLTLNGQAGNALAASVVKNVTKAIGGVRVSYEGSTEVWEAPVAGAPDAQGRSNK